MSLRYVQSMVARKIAVTNVIVLKGNGNQLFFLGKLWSETADKVDISSMFFGSVTSVLLRFLLVYLTFIGTYHLMTTK